MNSDFAIALHILGFLTSRGGGPLTSEEIARLYGTNAVVIRRVQSKLNKAGLIETRRGVGGGSVLARNPEDINLREAYEAVSPEPEILPRHPASCQQVVPIVVGQFVNEICSDAEEALLRQLESMTIKAMDRTIRSRIRKALSAKRSARRRKAAS
ncbi:MAG: Rrf2 family transcriptional regulator [Planctomycetota bacterium]